MYLVLLWNSDKREPLQNGTGWLQPPQCQPIHMSKQDYSLPDYSVPDNLTHYYDPVTQTNCALVYLFKRVSSRVAWRCFSSKTRSEIFSRDSAIRFWAISKFCIPGDFGISFSFPISYLTLPEVYQTPPVKKKQQHANISTEIDSREWYVFRWSLCGKGGSLQQLWCLLYHWGWWVLVGFNLWGWWGSTSEVGGV